MPSHDTAATTVDDSPSTKGERKMFAAPVPGVA
jgi:hypothetical protein